MKKELKKTKGITLVTLVVTVIVLMVLAGITVTLVLGQNGIIGKAKQASAQTKQSTAEEDLKMMLAEYDTNKETGDTETLKDYLDKQVTAGKIDSEQVNGSNYDVTLEGYVCTIDSNILNIINTSKAVGPQVSNIKVVGNIDGTGDNLGEQSTTSGTTLYITFTAIMPDGSSLTVNPNVPYAVTQNGTYNFTITGKVDGKDVTKTVSIKVNEFKIKAGDFVNYTAGVWTQTEINSLGSLYSGASLPTDSNLFQFGGFKAGDSKDAIVPNGAYGSSKYSSGWRILSLNGDGSIQNIIHAGNPEVFYFDANSSKGIVALARNWSMYVNSTYAISAHCMTKDEVAATTNDVRTTGTYYWLDTAYGTGCLWCDHADGSIGYDGYRSLGVRPVVSLKSGIQITGGSGTWADPYQIKN